MTGHILFFSLLGLDSSNGNCFLFYSACLTSENMYFVLQGATIVDQLVSITPVQNYVAKREMQVNLLRNFAISFQVL